MTLRTMKKTKKQLLKHEPPNTGVAGNTMLAHASPCFLNTGMGAGFVSHKSDTFKQNGHFWIREFVGKYFKMQFCICYSSIA